MKRFSILTILIIWFLVGFAPKELVPVSNCVEFDMIYNGKQQPEPQPDAFEFFKTVEGISVLPEVALDLDETDPEFYLFGGLIGDTDPRAKKVIYVSLLQSGEDYYLGIFMMNPDQSEYVWFVILDMKNENEFSVCGAYIVSAENTIKLWVLLK